MRIETWIALLPAALLVACSDPAESQNTTDPTGVDLTTSDTDPTGSGVTTDDTLGDTSTGTPDDRSRCRSERTLTGAAPKETADTYYPTNLPC